MKLAQKLDTVAATVPRGKSDPSFQMRKQQHNSVSRGVDSGVGGGALGGGVSDFGFHNFCYVLYAIIMIR